MTTPRLVLASASPRRVDVLRQLGLSPEIMPAHVDESYMPGESPEEHVERLARDKASAIAEREPGAIVVGGDTIVLDGSRVLGKPVDEEDAVHMLLSLSRGSHEVLSGIAIAGSHGVVSRVSRTTVRFGDISAETARQYVRTGEPLDKAGAYGIQGMGAALVTGLDGDYYTVVGFPVPAFVELLSEAGWSYDFGVLSPTH